MFWLGDGGWAMWGRSNVQITGQQALEISRERARRLGMSPLDFRPSLPPSSRPSGANSLSASGDLFSMADIFSAAFKRGFGKSAAHTLIDMMDRILGLGPIIVTDPSTTLPVSPTIKPSDHLSDRGLRHSSLLSNITFLNQLTDSPALNKVVIDILEGQLIALFVVVVSILIFLIREWVVQQQFGINFEGEMNEEIEPRLNPADVNAGPRAVAEDQAQAQEPRANAEPRANEEPGVDAEPRPQGPETSEGLPGTPVGTSTSQVDFEYDADESNSGELLQLTPSSSSRRLAQTDQPASLTDDDAAVSTGNPGPLSTRGGDGETISVPLTSRDRETEVPHTRDPSEAEPHRHRRRPRLQSRNSSSTAVQIHRAVEEDGKSQVEHSPPSGKIMQLWLQANRNMDEFLNKARQEEPTTDLQLAIDVLSRLQEIDPKGLIPATLQIADKFVAKADARSIERHGDNNAEDQEGSLGIFQSDLRGIQPRDSPLDKGKRKVLRTSTHSPAPEERPAYDPIGTPDRANTSKSFWQVGYDEGGVEGTESWSPAPSETPHPPIPESPGHHTSAWDPSVRRYLESNRMDTSPLPTRSRSSSIDGRAGSNSEVSYPDNSGESSLEPSHDGQEQPAVQEGQLNLQGTNLPPEPRRGILRNAIDWLWGDIDANQPQNDLLAMDFGEHAPHNIINPRPNPIARRMGDRPRNPFGPDVGDEEDEGAEAALLAGPDLEDAEAIEDADDFDGILELAGVRGPLVGLFQNAMFSVVLLSTAVAAGIWIPYMWGKVVLVILANPILIFVKLPLQWVSLLAELTVDLTLFFGGSILSWLDRLTRLFLGLFLPSTPFITRFTQSTVISDSALLMSERALDRIARFILASSFRFSAMDYPVFSVTSYKALQSLKTIPRDMSGYLCEFLVSIYQAGSGPIWSLLRPWMTLKHISLPSFHSLIMWFHEGLEIASKEISGFIFSLGKLRASSFNIEIPKQTNTIDSSSSSMQWTVMDRVITIVAGYAMFSLLGAIYVRKGTPFSTSEQGRKIEGIIHAGLVQAGGILKVVIIISIEMIVFPLYCGVLLDLALLPLFHGATFLTRLEFTRNSPWTSAFVHWFVGTCYMFHFALFVSLCRKILRRGVLCE